MKPGAEAYGEFLASPEWAAIRLNAALHWGTRCAVCNASRIEWHHLFYPEVWANTQNEHLMPLCRLHHSAAGKLPSGGWVRFESQIPSFRNDLVARLRADIKRKRQTRQQRFDERRLPQLLAFARRMNRKRRAQNWSA